MSTAAAALETLVFEAAGTSHEIGVAYNDGDPLFRAADIGGVLGIVNYHESTKDFDGDEKRLVLHHTPGGAQQIAVLTEAGACRLIARSNKPIARSFYKWIFAAFASIRQRKEIALMEQMVLRKDDLEDQHHNSILQAHRDVPLVYIGKIRTAGDEMLIKIGSTGKITTRSAQLRAKYGSMVFLHVFPCDNNGAMETMLHNHPSIKPHKFFDEIVPGETSTEVFLLDQAQLDEAVRIAKHSVSKYKEGNGKFGVQELKKMIMERDAVTVPAAAAATMDGKETPPPEFSPAPAIAPGYQRHLDKATAILNDSDANLYQVACALAFVTGLTTLPLFKGTLVGYGPGSSQYICRFTGGLEGRVLLKTGYDVITLVPFPLVLSNLCRLQAGKPAQHLSNSETNATYANSLNFHARSFAAEASSFNDIATLFHSAVSGGSGAEKAGRIGGESAHAYCSSSAAASAAEIDAAVSADEDQMYINKATAILEDTRSKPLRTAAALGFVSGLCVPEIFKGTITEIAGKPYEALFEGGIVKKNHSGGAIKLLLPFKIVKEGMTRLQAECNTRDMDNRDINLKFSNNSKRYVGEFLGRTATFKELLKRYKEAVENAAFKKRGVDEVVDEARGPLTKKMRVYDEGTA